VGGKAVRQQGKQAAESPDCMVARAFGRYAVGVIANSVKFDYIDTQPGIPVRARNSSGALRRRGAEAVGR